MEHAMTHLAKAQRAAELENGAWRWEQEAKYADARAAETAGRVEEVWRARAAECRAQAARNRELLAGLRVTDTAKEG